MLIFLLLPIFPIVSMIGFGPHCTLADSQEPFNFRREYDVFINYLSNTNGTSFEEIVERCVHINYYAPIVDRCYEYDEVMREDFAAVQKLCSTAEYLIGNFSKCDKKLEGEKSKCFLDWKQKIISVDNNNQKNEAEREKCLGKEITENCDKETWESFRKNIIETIYTVEASNEPESSNNELEMIVTGLISNAGKCSTADHMVHAYADLGIMEFGKTLKAINVTSHAELNIINGNCKLMEDIFLLIDRCNGFGRRTIRLRCDSYKRLCSIVDFLDIKFKYCSKKLEESECYKDWRQQKISSEHNIDDEVTEKPKAFCSNCLKDDITRTCGVEDWEKFREMIQRVEKTSKDCDFDNNV